MLLNFGDIMKKNIFCVIQSGVYRHDIFGIYDEKEKAIAVADELAKTDGDSGMEKRDGVLFTIKEDGWGGK